MKRMISVETRHRTATLRHKPARRMRCGIVAALAAVAIPGFAGDAHAAGPTELRFAYPDPPNTPQYTDFIQPWTAKLNKEGEGLFHVKVFVGTTLANMGNALDRVETDVAQIGFCILGPVSRQFPQTLVATLPLVANNAHEAGLALQRLYDKGVIADEWTKVKPLAFGVYPALTFHTVPMVKTLDDLKGLKISVQGRIAGETLEALGGTPITLPIDELYEALQRGTIEGSALGWPGITANKLTDIVKHHVLEPLGGAEVAIVMNKAAYARLPKKAKDVIDANSGTVFTAQLNDFVDHTTQQAIDDIRHMKGQTIETLSPAQQALWRTRIEPVIASWEKSTPDGTQVLAAFREQVKAIRSGS